MPIVSSRVVRQHVQREGETFVVLEHLDSIGRAYMQLLRDTNPSTLRTRLPTIIANFEARLKKREIYNLLGLIERGESHTGIPIEFNTTQELRSLIVSSIPLKDADIARAQAEKARLEANAT